MIREGRWEIIEQLLPERIQIRGRAQTKSEHWEILSQHLPLLLDESRKRGRASMHGDLIAERHKAGTPLGAFLSLEDFIDADFFLFLVSAAHDSKIWNHWRAWSAVSLGHTPTFIINSARKAYAARVTKAIGIGSFDDLKELLRTKGPELRELFKGSFWRYRVDDQEVERIGSR